MSLFDSIVGSVLGSGVAQGALQSALGAILNRSEGQGGGLQDLVQRMEQLGLGDIARSWIGNGPNQPIDPQSLGQVLGQDRLQQLSQTTGLDQNTLLQHLSSILPHAVDQATPNGEIPADPDPFDGSGIDASKT